MLMIMLGYRWRKAELLLPRTFTDAAAFTLLSCAIPIVYWFEVFVVMPRVFNSFFHVIHIFLGTFVLLNVITNFGMMVVVDTSTKGHIMPATVPHGWHVCAPCENVAPPRSRHCGICGCCVLKREHHCIFTGCCIGLYNHRFFVCFLVYMWLSTLYCSVVNAFFISPYIEEDRFWWTCIRIVLPGLWLIMNPSAETFYGFLFSLNVIGCLFLSVLLYYYTRQMLVNITTRERTDNCPISYDKGILHNIQKWIRSNWTDADTEEKRERERERGRERKKERETEREIHCLLYKCR
ncbi:Palmitoyltransferase DHHC domain [Trinorchestia longiramus]|nr:Palmitoyltransferase DHHC domain [Trinorchestia longiramus]